MNDILRHWLAAPCILLLTVTAYSQDFDRAKPWELGISAERLERLSATLEDYVEQEQVAGSVTLVLRRGWVVYFDAVGYRDAASQAPMREDTIFRIASQTKAIVSAAAMILQEEGKLLISTKSAKTRRRSGRRRWPSRRTRAKVTRIVLAERPVTIHDLLTHTSGFDYGDGLSKRQMGRWPASKATTSRTATSRSAKPWRAWARCRAVAQPGEEMGVRLQHRHPRRRAGESVRHATRRAARRPPVRAAPYEGHALLPAGSQTRAPGERVRTEGREDRAHAGGRLERAGRLRRRAAQEFLGWRRAPVDRSATTRASCR